MFEKEAENYSERTMTEVELEVLNTVHDWGQESLSPNERRLFNGIQDRKEAREQGFKDGAELGYNKANEWHYVKSEEDLPKESGRYLVYVGGGENGVYPLDFDTEANDFGYWCLQVGASLGVTDTIFETVTERNEDKVIAWKEIVLPELKESE